MPNQFSAARLTLSISVSEKLEGNRHFPNQNIDFYKNFPQQTDLVSSSLDPLCWLVGPAEPRIQWAAMFRSTAHCRVQGSCTKPVLPGLTILLLAASEFI